MSSIVKQIKTSIQRSGGSKGKIIKVFPDKKVRIRFLDEMEDGRVYNFHNDFNEGIDAVCLADFGEECPLCDDEVYSEQRWAWSVWDLDAKQVKVLLWKATSKSPVAQFLSYYEVYETIMDRDYVISRKGSMLDTTYQVVPMDKSKFRNEKAKPLSKSGLEKLLRKAFPIRNLDLDVDDVDEEEEVEETKPAKKKKGKTSKKSKEVVEELDIAWLEEKLDSEDIDEDDFCEYHEVDSLDDLTSKTKKGIKKMINAYIDNAESDEDEDDDEDDYDDEDDE